MLTDEGHDFVQCAGIALYENERHSALGRGRPGNVNGSPDSEASVGDSGEWVLSRCEDGECRKKEGG